MRTQLATDEVSCDALLTDGTFVHVRAIQPADAGRLVRFHESLSTDTVYLRFFSHHKHLTETEVQRFSQVDGRRRMALVAVLNDDLVGVARYDRDPDDPEQAEVAFVVADAWQGRGVGTFLLQRLARYAHKQGIRRLTAETLPFNTRMQAVFRQSGFAEEARFEDGVVRVRLDLATACTGAWAVTGGRRRTRQRRSSSAPRTDEGELAAGARPTFQEERCTAKAVRALSCCVR